MEESERDTERGNYEQEKGEEVLKEGLFLSHGHGYDVRGENKCYNMVCIIIRIFPISGYEILVIAQPNGTFAYLHAGHYRKTTEVFNSS